MAPKKGVQQQASGSEKFKWILVLILLIGGVVANSYFEQVAWALRAAAGIVVTAAALSIALQTLAGQQAWAFVKGARVEMRKVVWPTRQETLQTTLMVVVMVVVMAIILWGIDTLFMWLISLLAG